MSELFPVESIYDNATDAEKLAAILDAGAAMRAAQQNYFAAKGYESKKEFLKLSKVKEREFDNLVKLFSESKK